MRGSLFRRVTRYPVAASLDPRENRLTEVTAAVLDEVNGFAHAFVRHVLDHEREAVERGGLAQEQAGDRARLHLLARELKVARVEVNTQVGTAQSGFVDLEVLLRPQVGSPQRGLLVWVEVKHGADLHGDQLKTYLQDIRLRPVADDVERVVVLLAPRGWEPKQEDAVPDSVVRAHWQSVGRVAKAALDPAQPAEQNWLLSQYIHYLKEESLSEPEALTAVSALALMEVNRASEAAWGVCEYADTHVQEHWGARGSHRHSTGRTPAPIYGPGYYANYEPHRQGSEAHPGWRGGWFEWGLRDTSRMQYLDETPRGAWAFMAGATFVSREDRPTEVAGNEGWLAGQVAEGFRPFWIDSYRFARLRYPDELLNETALEPQGHELGRWIVKAFGELADNLPPA